MKRCFLIVGILCIIVVLLVGCEPGSAGTPPGSTTETIGVPSTPSGPSAGNVNELLTYSTGGSTSSLGHSVQYRFSWGDGSYSEWSSSTSASHSWSSSGNYMVQAQARSSANPDITSSWSGSRSVTIETISTPSTPTGPSTGNVNEALTYSTGGSTSSLGHSIQYRFNWGDGRYSEWLSSTSASHSWSSSGNYMVQAQARSSTNPSIVSSWSGSKSVIIAVPSSSVTYAEIRNSMNSMTDAQWGAYVRSLEGEKIRWTGYVEDVKETYSGDYELLVDMDAPEVLFSVYEVSFKVPSSVALSLNKDQQIEFEGIISSVSSMLGMLDVSLKQAKVIGY